MNKDSGERRLLADWLDDNSDVSLAVQSREITENDRQDIADEILTHALLVDLASHNEVANTRRIERLMKALHSSPVTSTKKQNSRRNVFYGIFGTAACLFVFAFALSRPTPVTASVVLQKIIASVSEEVDRTYRLAPIVDGKQRNLPSRNDFDGAMLHVGGPDRFVFIHRLSDGQIRCSGCDGTESWVFREEGPVHVSYDLQRFHGRIPGQQHNLGFTDLFSQLDSLRNSYNLTLSKTDNINVELLIGEKKSRSVRGPKKIEVEYDRDDGTVLAMRLTGLPRAQGGPDGMRLTLVSQSSLDPDFYSHASHHSEQRKVRFE